MKHRGWRVDKREERAASRQTIGESLFPTPYYLLLFASKTQRPGRSKLLQARVPNSVLLCDCATRMDIRSQERPGQAPTGATRVTPSHIGCVSGKVKLIRPADAANLPPTAGPDGPDDLTDSTIQPVQSAQVGRPSPCVLTTVCPSTGCCVPMLLPSCVRMAPPPAMQRTRTRTRTGASSNRQHQQQQTEQAAPTALLHFAVATPPRPTASFSLHGTLMMSRTTAGVYLLTVQHALLLLLLPLRMLAAL